MRRENTGLLTMQTEDKDFLIKNSKNIVEEKQKILQEKNFYREKQRIIPGDNLKFYDQIKINLKSYEYVSKFKGLFNLIFTSI